MEGWPSFKFMCVALLHRSIIARVQINNFQIMPKSSPHDGEDLGWKTSSGELGTLLTVFVSNGFAGRVGRFRLG